MVYKRPFGGEESYELACKHPRQLEFGEEVATFVEIASCDDIPQKPQASVGEGEGVFHKSQGDERLVSNTIAELLTQADLEFETTGRVSISSFSWVTSSTSEEDSRSEAAVRVSFPPGFSEPDYSERVLVKSDEIYSSLLDNPPRKRVPIGPEYQADVPAWGPQGIKEASGYLDTSDPISSTQSSVSDNGYQEKLMGTCIIPMPDLEPSTYSGDKFGCDRIDCGCSDGGSIRCMRQHIMEARERLRVTLGQERFMKLGFCDMGEEVARKWSEEEEQVFHQVVFSNPASLGKNFWNRLPVVFPSLMKKDLVSYYFNVFMLRKRAEQNRATPLNIDSDDDEWQGSDDGEEFGTTEDYEDSVVESPVDQDDPGCNQNQEVYFHEGDDEDEDETYDNNDDSDVEDDRDAACKEDEGGVHNVSEVSIKKSVDDCSFDPMVKLANKHPRDGGEDHDVQDDSCTSYECQLNGTDSSSPVDPGFIMQEIPVDSGSNKRLKSIYDGSGDGFGHGYVLDPCDAKVWDIGYLTCPKKNVEFLPTCSMIEEVFGEEAWNNKTDCKGIS